MQEIIDALDEISVKSQFLKIWAEKNLMSCWRNG
ncbi:hypothetical protein B0P06_004843 [Clostridium saccharoperbutylacetonicum]|nr:hypothetical protein [Clostridium saccharoperbutylacetonicum]NSB25703.1 hypothetical protein [Clostridium saccharoperbutylacetonicum]NSB45072.1 hypothetical protein [Clostridium saccharoperbutylacetonicum]